MLINLATFNDMFKNINKALVWKVRAIEKELVVAVSTSNSTVKSDVKIVINDSVVNGIKTR